MKLNRFFAISALLAALTPLLLSSCGSASSLSDKLDGSWAGVPERLFDAGASSATMIRTYTFSLSDSIKNGGNVTLAALVSVTGAIDGTPGITEAVSLTASGFASIKGTWQAISADRVELALDQSTLSVTVDPDAVIINSDMVSADAIAPPSVSAMRPQLAASIASQLKQAIAANCPAAQTLTGVKLTDDDNTLRFKTGKSSFILTRQLR